jgi:hypothetical protein
MHFYASPDNAPPGPNQAARSFIAAPRQPMNYLAHPKMP